MELTGNSFTENDGMINIDYSRYGRYTVKDNLELNLPHNKISFARINDDKFSYHRTGHGNESVDKIITTKTKDLQIELSPTLPIHLPAYKTDFIFLRFTNQLFLSRNIFTEISIPFPIEIGVFVVNDTFVDNLDFFACEPLYSRFGLYGPTEEGKLCKYAKIRLNDNKIIPFIHAKMKVKIHNELEKATSLGRMVLPVTDHDLYYDGINARIDNLKVYIKNRGGLELAEIIQDKISNTKGWTRAPRDMEKTDYKFSMELGFD